MSLSSVMNSGQTMPNVEVELQIFPHSCKSNIHSTTHSTLFSAFINTLLTVPTLLYLTLMPSTASITLLKGVYSTQTWYKPVVIDVVRSYLERWHEDAITAQILYVLTIRTVTNVF